MDAQRRRTIIQAYAVAASLVTAAVIVELAIRPFFAGRVPLAVFTIAVALSATYGGWGPGLFSIALSAAAVTVFFANSFISLLPERPNLLFFILLGLGITAIVETLRRRNRALSEAKFRLEAANRELENRAALLTLSNEELSRFAYALSHDLQTPLRTISLFADRLDRHLQGKLDADGQSAIGFILAGARRSQEMIRSLLDYATAAAQTRPESIADLNAALEQALEDLRPVAEEAHARITHDPLPSVRGDGSQLRSVLLNLLSNALKYRSTDPPEIHVQAERSKNMWILSVRDNGIGIDMQYADKIFHLFERLHSADEYSGSGIGLATCRAVIERHGGKIWLESEPGRGSTFFFSLPA